MKTRTIALSGAIGHLGGLIASAILDHPGAHLKLLVRPGKQHRAAMLVERGARIVETRS